MIAGYHTCSIAALQYFKHAVLQCLVSGIPAPIVVEHGFDDHLCEPIGCVEFSEDLAVFSVDELLIEGPEHILALAPPIVKADESHKPSCPVQTFGVAGNPARKPFAEDLLGIGG